MFSFQETGPMATFRSVRNENKISLLWIERKLSLQTFLVFPFLLYIALAKLLSLFPSVIDRPNWISIRDFRAHIGISLAFSISPRSISRFRFFTRASRYPIRVVCIPAPREKKVSFQNVKPNAASSSGQETEEEKNLGCQVSRHHSAITLARQNEISMQFL